MSLVSELNAPPGAYLKLMRIDHWIKNLFMIPGAVFAFAFTPENIEIDSKTFFGLILSCFGLCFASSSNYVMNEWLDRAFDAKHPFKNHRVSNLYNFSAAKVWLLYISNILITIAIMVFLNNQVIIFLIFLLVMGFLYNVEPIRLKDKHYFDVLSESINNPIRLAIGWYAISLNDPVPASAFIGFWGIGIFLMALKRYSEMSLINSADLLTSYRKSFKYWTPQKLLIFSMVGALIAASFMGIFLVKYRVEYILVFPALIWIFAEYLRISLNLEPVSYAPELLMRKKNLIALVLLIGLLFFILTFINIPILGEFLNMDEGL